MNIKKKAGSFNDYALDLSYGELVAIEHALAENHSGPVADELYAGIKWYLDELPKPGEDTEQEKKKKENGGEGEDFSGEHELDDAEPEPPSEAEEGADEYLPAPEREAPKEEPEEDTSGRAGDDVGAGL